MNVILSAQKIKTADSADTGICRVLPAHFLCFVHMGLGTCTRLNVSICISCMGAHGSWYMYKAKCKHLDILYGYLLVSSKGTQVTVKSLSATDSILSL